MRAAILTLWLIVSGSAWGLAQDPADEGLPLPGGAEREHSGVLELGPDQALGLRVGAAWYALRAASREVPLRSLQRFAGRPARLRGRVEPGARALLVSRVESPVLRRGVEGLAARREGRTYLTVGARALPVSGPAEEVIATAAGSCVSAEAWVFSSANGEASELVAVSLEGRIGFAVRLEGDAPFLPLLQDGELVDVLDVGREYATVATREGPVGFVPLSCVQLGWPPRPAAPAGAGDAGGVVGALGQ